MTDLSQYNATHCCRYCLCAGVVAHFDNCPRPRRSRTACEFCTTVCYPTPLGWYCTYHGFVDVYDPI